MVRRAASRRSAGHVLVVTLLVVAVTLSAGTLLAGSIGYRLWLLRQEARQIHLTVLTDAAVARALAELSRHPGYRGTDGAEAFGDGTLAIASRPAGSQKAVVEVRATYGGGGRATRLEVDLFPLAVRRFEPISY